MYIPSRCLVITFIMLIGYSCYAQYSDNTFMISFKSGTTQAEIDQALEDLNSEELLVSPISETRLWRVLSFPFYYPPNNQWIANINEGITSSKGRAKTNSAGLNFSSATFEAVNTSVGPYLRFPDDSQLDCHGDLSTYTRNGASPVEIGVFDTGLNYGNPSYPNYFFDLAGYTEYDHINTDPIAEDDNGHGTHVASILSHTINKSYGLWQSSIAPYESYDIRKTFDSKGDGYLFEIIYGLEVATLQGMKIANCSWSFRAQENEAYESPLYNSLSILEEQYGVLIVAAAGNDGEDLDRPRHLKNYPANYNLPNILSATTYDCSNGLASFANYGVKSVDIALPGLKVAGLDRDQNIVFKSGTSQSTALLSGIAASLATHQQTFDYEEIICAIIESADTHPVIKSKVRSNGIINADEALKILGNCGMNGYSSATRSRIGNSTLVFPNPTNGQFNIKHNSESEGIIEVSLSDLQGKVISLKQFDIVEGENVVNYDLESAVPGVYSLFIQKGQNFEVIKLVIEK